MGLVIRILLLAGGLFASLFVTKDSFHYPVLSMIFGLLLFTMFVAIGAYRSTIMGWFRGKKENNDSNEQ